MSADRPQILEPHLDEILAGTATEPDFLKSILRTLLVIRRRYNDPCQNGEKQWRDPVDPRRDDLSRLYTPTTRAGQLGDVGFHPSWSIDSQKARVEQGIAFLTPKVGAAVGSYPPITNTDPRTGWSADSMGNIIPAGKP